MEFYTINWYVVPVLCFVPGQNVYIWVPYEVCTVNYFKPAYVPCFEPTRNYFQVQKFKLGLLL